MTGKVPVVSLSLKVGAKYPVTNTCGNSGYPIALTFMRLGPDGDVVFHNGRIEVTARPYLWMDGDSLSVCFYCGDDKPPRSGATDKAEGLRYMRQPITGNLWLWDTNRQSFVTI